MGKHMVSPFSVLKGSSRGFLTLLVGATIGLSVFAGLQITGAYLLYLSEEKTAETIERALNQEKVLVDSRLLFTPSSDPLVKIIQRKECVLRKEIYDCAKEVIDNKQDAEEIISCYLDQLKEREDRLEMHWEYIQEYAQSASHAAEVNSRFREWQSVDHSSPLDCLMDLKSRTDSGEKIYDFNQRDFVVKWHTEECILPALEKQMKIINEVIPCSVSRR